MRINGTTLAEEALVQLEQTAIPYLRKKVCFVLFGDNMASEQFVKRKVAVAERLHIDAEIVRSNVVTTEEALMVIDECITKQYDGIVVQLPLPAGIDREAVINRIPIGQDIDCLGEQVKKSFINGQTGRMPPVAYAVQQILASASVDLTDKQIVIVGNGKLVGEPVRMLFDRFGTHYSVIDIDTPAQEKIALLPAADIIVSGIGVPHWLMSDMIKDSVMLIDAGTSEQAGKLAGDIDPACESKASLYTPVPGGVGPLTVAGLFVNLFTN